MIVWLASFPRSGNTFFRTIIKQCFGKKTYSLYNDEADIAKSKILSGITGHTQFYISDLEDMRASEEVFFIKTHAPDLSLVNNDDYSIYLVRDGRDATCSYFSYLHRYNNEKLSLKDIIDGNAYFGPWHKHVAIWSGRKNRHMNISFQKLISTPGDVVKEVSNLFGLDVLSSDISSFAQLHAIDSDFFRKNSDISYKHLMNVVEHNYFWYKSYEQMIELDYVQDMPPLFEDKNFIEFAKCLELCSAEKQINAKSEECAQAQQGVGTLRDALERRYCESAQNVEKIAALKADVEREQKKCADLQAEKSRLENSYRSQITSLQSSYDALAEEHGRVKNAFDAHAGQMAAFDNAVGFMQHLQQLLPDVNAKLLSLEEAFVRQARENTLLRMLVAEERYRLQRQPLRSCLAALLQRGNPLPANFAESPLPCTPSQDLEELILRCADMAEGLSALDGGGSDLSQNLAESATALQYSDSCAIGDMWADVSEPWSSDAFCENESPSLVACPEKGQRLHALHCLWEYEHVRVVAQTENMPGPGQWAAEAEDLQQKNIYFPFMGKNVLYDECRNGSDLSALLRGNIAFAHYAADAPLDFLDWCVATATPICVNRTAAVQEKLGPAYPLYMYSVESALHLLHDKDRILEAHTYLLSLRARSSAVAAVCDCTDSSVIMTPETIKHFAYATKENCASLDAQYGELFAAKCYYNANDRIKYYQDLHVIAFIEQNIPQGSRILDIGGGFSRILQYFENTHECWCIDAYEGNGNGPTEIPNTSWKIVKDYMGNFNQELPNDYFDIVFSISVMEHLPKDGSTVLDVYTDINRVLKKNGFSFHTVDVVLSGENLYFCPFIQKQVKAAATRITPVHNASIMKNDSNMWFMDKETYAATWQHVIKLDYETFGKPSFVNMLWRRDY